MTLTVSCDEELLALVRQAVLRLGRVARLPGKKKSRASTVETPKKKTPEIVRLTSEKDMIHIKTVVAVLMLQGTERGEKLREKETVPISTACIWQPGAAVLRAREFVQAVQAVPIPELRRKEFPHTRYGRA